MSHCKVLRWCGIRDCADWLRPSQLQNHSRSGSQVCHTTIWKLRDVETGETLLLEYGYQLECR
jgi:hypothetical protein